MVSQIASRERAAAFRKRCLSFGEDLLDRVQIG